MYWTSRWFLGLESFLITAAALHIVDDQGQKEETFDYISGVAKGSKYQTTTVYTAIQVVFILSRPELFHIHGLG
jgi:hypothetical protein